ncbi:hypothetical protein [Aeromicrobium fastidiosum]|uniref:Uncharacterized protein n=1 Tax=Aeromicrobium fastidiosum TaxID=52699 RepID=A0A641AN06_9ACTN|nr:hypothetical protein [Aeromicrobium fastidiosum]KAA1376304.1 hypothetical protein ESP62_012780 [Aeromicrobium fastidiosum]MBP2391798.1 hypothetical protein [Aeromicrobium fastidiosum]
MTTPIPDLLAAVPAINDPQEPFVFTVEGDRIIGAWDIVKATTLYPSALEVEHVDEDYRITVELDADKGTYDVTENRTSTTGSADIDGDTLKLGGEKQFFSGKSTSKQFNVSFGGITKKDDEPLTVAPLVYSFETSRIKDPLFAFLEQHGWKRKKGFLGGLFNR